MLPVLLPLGLLALVFIVAPIFVAEWARERAMIIGRLLQGIKRQISPDEATSIAWREAAHAERGWFATVREQMATYEVYVEINPRFPFAQECKAMCVTIDIQNGEVLTSAEVSCEHHHDCI